jgi:Na+/H+ antiporter NhaD/arsenite permease-like protein
VFPEVPFLPIGRTAGSILGATLMVVFQVISPNAAFDAVDLPILGLLWGTMVISVYLKRAGLFKHLEKAMMWKSRGGLDFLCRLCLLSALSSALFTNDTTCVVLTGFVLELCKQKKLHPKPFLIALACSSNIGSAATPIGNPQNLVIALYSKISFGRFIAGELPAVALGLVVNTLLLMVVYSRSLSIKAGDSLPTRQIGDPSIRLQILTTESDVSMRASSVLHNGEVGTRDAPRQTEGEISFHYDMTRETLPEQVMKAVSAAVLKALGAAVSMAVGNADRETQRGAESAPKKSNLRKVLALVGGVVCGKRGVAMLGQQRKRFRELWKKYLWKASVYLVTLGMLAALLAGLSLPWSAITAAVVMTILDFSDAGPNLDQVSYALLVFFSGMFIATSGFNNTGAPQEFWLAVEPHSRIDSASGISVLSSVVTVLSNVVSNVPTVILLGPRVAASAATTPGASSDKAWLILAWVSTVAGNLTLVGSAANLIVCEQARPTQADRVRRKGQSMDLQGPDRATYDLTFWNHLKFGFPSTLIVIAVGLLPLAFQKF